MEPGTLIDIARASSNVCYYCAKEKSTREHVPPLCLFPEKHIFNRDFRKNLITVNSCDEHNSKKSGSDEILRQILVASPFSNFIAQGLIPDKWRRANERNPKLISQLLDGGKPISYILEGESEWQQGWMKDIDCDDLDESLRRICAGLYFGETGTRLIGVPSIITGFTKYLDEKAQRHNEKELERVRNYFSSAPLFGENPEVFCYGRRYSGFLKTFYLVFYGGNEVLVRYSS